MVQFNGKYQIVESHNFKELLVRSGVPEDKAAKASEAASVVEVKIEGNKVTIQADEHLENHKSEFIIDGESVDNLPSGPVKNFCTRNGNVITVQSKGTDGNLVASRKYTFTDSGVESVHTSASGDFTATRIYKRL